MECRLDNPRTLQLHYSIHRPVSLSSHSPPCIALLVSARRGLSAVLGSQSRRHHPLCMSSGFVSPVQFCKLSQQHSPKMSEMSHCSRSGPTAAATRPAGASPQHRPCMVSWLCTPNAEAKGQSCCFRTRQIVLCTTHRLSLAQRLAVYHCTSRFATQSVQLWGDITPTWLAMALLIYEIAMTQELSLSKFGPQQISTLHLCHCRSRGFYFTIHSCTLSPTWSICMLFVACCVD